MNRITWKNVEYYLAIVNAMTKNKYKFYKTSQGNQLCMETGNSGLTEVSRFLNTTEAYEVVYTLYKVLNEENKHGN